MFSSINTCWVLVAAFLVYFMQAGFALCEAGFTRAKNTGNILMKNMMDFCIGTPCYWVIGFVAGILVVLSVEFFDKIARIDDPVGAVSVHFANGVWGTIAVGLFSNGGDGVGRGLFYGGGFAQLGTLLPKIKVEVIVSKISVDAVVDAAKKALYTGHISDGKIFVYNVTRVVKIRTGEEDFAALQDVE